MDDRKPGRGRRRLDQLLVERGLCRSRAQARDAILRGAVKLDGTVAVRPGMAVAPGIAMEVSDPAGRYVSRAALKLVAGLDRFGFDPRDLVGLDIGASTGGFTQVLLERGAAHVFSVDVGHGQLAPGLASDPRVTVLEGTNARELAERHLHGRAPGFVVADVSFISLRLALPPALSLAGEGAFCVLLVKPQFEAGREALGKGGVVRDPGLAASVAEALRLWLDARPGWRAIGLVASPIAGGDGNREFLLGGVKDR